MENQEILNSIAVLSSSIDPLLRADKKDIAEEVSNKISELTKMIIPK